MKLVPALPEAQATLAGGTLHRRSPATTQTFLIVPIRILVIKYGPLLQAAIIWSKMVRPRRRTANSNLVVIDDFTN